MITLLGLLQQGGDIANRCVERERGRVGRCFRKCAVRQRSVQKHARPAL
jgi:hypothetical protein